MSELKKPPRACLVISLIAGTEDIISKAMDCLAGTYGPVMFRTPLMPFDWTSYYEREFGKNLVRRFVVFKELVEQARLTEIKLEVHRQEQRFSSNGKRLVNIDPGILTAERLVLATGKNFTHRIYLGKGVFADLTLVFQKGRFDMLPWTYPDYASRDALEFLEQARTWYLNMLKAEGENRSGR